MKQQIDRILTDQILEGIDFEMWEALRREQKERGFKTMGDCLAYVLSEQMVTHLKERCRSVEAAKFQRLVNEYNLRRNEIMPTTVIHVRDMREGDVYIGRYVGRGKRKFAASIWQNPPDIGKIGKHGTREEVIAKFEAYILAKPELLAQLHTLRGKRLACWCKPKACHGDVLARLADAS